MNINNPIKQAANTGDYDTTDDLLQIKRLEAADFLAIAQDRNDMRLLISYIEAGSLSHSKAMEVAMYSINYINAKCVEAQEIMAKSIRSKNTPKTQAYREAIALVKLAKEHLQITTPAFEKYPLAQGVLISLFDLVSHHEYSAVVFPSMITEQAYMAENQSTYFILNPVTGMIKIGKSCDMSARKQALQCGAGTDLRLLAIVDKDVEKELHKKFAAYRHYGEWFDDRDGAIRAYMDSLAHKRWGRRYAN